jgi:hypothetical protein
LTGTSGRSARWHGVLSPTGFQHEMEGGQQAQCIDKEVKMKDK